MRVIINQHAWIKYIEKSYRTNDQVVKTCSQESLYLNGMLHTPNDKISDIRGNLYKSKHVKY